MINVLSSLLLSVVEILIILYFSDIKYTVKVSKPTAYLFLGVLGITLFLGGKLNCIFFFIGCTVFSIFCCKAKGFSALFSSIILSVLLMFSQAIMILSMSAVFATDINTFHNSNLLTLIHNIFSLSVFIMAVYVILRFVDRRRKFYSPVSVSLLLLPITSFLISFVITKLFYEYNLSGDILLLFAGVNSLLLISNIIAFYLHDFAIKNYHYAEEIKNEYEHYKNQDKYYQKLKEQNENSRVLVHDISKHLNTIGQMSNNDGNIADYISTISEDFNVSNPVDYCSNATLNLITHRFYEKCKANNIRFDVNIREAKIDFMTAPDITALFDNLLENAFEASVLSEEKYIDFSVYVRNKNFVIINLINSSNIKPKYSNGEMITSKKTPFHGIGTKSIKRIVKKYDGEIDMHFNELENTFESTIMLHTV